MSKQTVECDGKKFQKTALFGNRKFKTIFANRKAYIRRKYKHTDKKERDNLH